MVRRAAAVLTISLFVVLLASWLIVATHDATLDQVVFEVVSAFATCGLTLGFTSELNTFGQLIIIAVMFWGRLGALTIITAIARQSTTPQQITYPEEQILIG
jgi:trk system potassium uptake protein TrkH